jgi:hypothetical protein
MKTQPGRRHRPTETNIHRPDRRGLNIRRISGLTLLASCVAFAVPVAGSYAFEPPPLTGTPPAPAAGVPTIPAGLQSGTHTQEDNPVNQQPVPTNPSAPPQVGTVSSPVEVPSSITGASTKTSVRTVAGRARPCKQVAHGKSHCLRRARRRSSQREAHKSDFLPGSFTPGYAWCPGDDSLTVSAIEPWGYQDGEALVARTNFYVATTSGWSYVASAPWIATLFEVGGFEELVHEPWTADGSNWYGGEESISGLTPDRYYAATQQVFWGSTMQLGENRWVPSSLCQT